MIDNTILLCFLPDHRSFEYLKKTKLQLIGPHDVHIVKGFLKTLIPLKRKTCYEI